MLFMSIRSAACRIAKLLSACGQKVVFAESCTGGLVSGALTAVPGISNYHCGGVVVYRNETKQAYLGIPADVLRRPGAVSEKVARLIAAAVLVKTPEADIGVSVTGHLGPHAPPALDGRVFVGLAARGPSDGEPALPAISVHQLQCNVADSRLKRQRWAVEQVLNLLGAYLEELS
jgi:PncC family amidohydrolase